ncbi:MAG: 23S rRNA (pseudouridine(1915)-N(3))-methyltransferase RlmH [Chthoniobacterales bacterium]
MIWHLVTVGKPALSYARAGRDEYLARLQRWSRIEQFTVKASDPGRESTALLKASEGCFRLLLDEEGKQMTSRTFAAHVGAWQQAARPVAVILGGADGHNQSLREAADFVWSLGPATLQHELALVVALEQIYRAHTILAGHPYHRDQGSKALTRLAATTSPAAKRS